MDATKNNEPATMPYVVYRDSVTHDRWIIKRLIVALIICVALVFASNLAWLIAWNQYDYVSDTTTIESEGNGIANYTGGNGGIVYGESDRPQDGSN